MLMSVNMMLRQYSITKNLTEGIYIRTVIKSCFSTATATETVETDGSLKKKNLNTAMRAYLERAREHEKFISQENVEYQIGKRHLANMMGVSSETFDQYAIDKSIEYLFPSGLYEPKARPLMKEPNVIFPPKKAAQFNEEGRPFHSLFYTLKPNYYSVLYDIVEQLEVLNNYEDEQLKKGILPNTGNRFNEIGSEWMSQKGFEEIFLEPLTQENYEALIASLKRLADHPWSNSAKDFIMKFRKMMQAQTTGLIIPPLEYDEKGRPFILVNDCWRHTARGTVKILGNGSGKIKINGKDITYFVSTQSREQVIFPLIFTGMEKKVDIEANVEGGGFSGQAGAIRWGISWGLRSFVDKKMVEKMRIAGLLTRDWRVKERKKPGQEGARRKFTWKKR